MSSLRPPILRLFSPWVLGVLLAATAATAPVREKGYPHKDITWIVPYAPGGGYDVYSRAIARILPRYLPGRYRVVVKSMPGAGGRRGAALLYRSPADGHTIGIMNFMGLLAGDLVKKSRQFDVERFTYLASCSLSIQGIFVSSRTAYRTLEDLKKAGRIRFASGGRGSSTWVWGVLLKEVANIPIHFVSGYQGTSDYLLALLRNDVDVASLSLTSAIVPHIREGNIRPLMVFSLESWPPWPEMATLKGTPYEDIAELSGERVIAGPPGLPKEIAAALQTALLRTLHDPDLQAWAKKTEYPLHIRDSEQTLAVVRRCMSLLQKYKRHFKK